jgi:hypothetical protein
MIGRAVWLTLLMGVAANSLEVTPIEKVITLIEGIRKEAVEEGKTEAKAYAKFACFCKKNTEKESKEIVKGNDKIGVLRADIKDEDQTKKNEISENSKRSKKQEAMTRQLAADVAQCRRDSAEYEAAQADMAKAISSLKSAIKAMKNSKPGRAFIALREVVTRSTVMPASANKAAVAFVQGEAGVDPSDPEFDYHSNDIIELMDSLLKDFMKKKEELDGNWKKREAACKKTQASYKKQLAANKEAMNTNKKDITKVKQKMSQDKEKMVGTEGSLKDDKAYLKAVTASCEARAIEWDQRSAQRNNEINSLSAALKILGVRVKKADSFANKRAALVQDSAKALSFLQVRRTLSTQQRNELSLAMLQTEARRLGSLHLSALAVRARLAGPFDKLKGLIDDLVERLVAESEAEASKKGFCDTALAKARHDRDARYSEAQDLSSDIGGLNAKEDELTEAVVMLTKGLKENNLAVKEATATRAEEKKGNAETIKVAKEGLAATSEAIAVLEKFYKQAAKAAFVQTKAPYGLPEAKGAYKGKQTGMKAVVDLLETIESDFERTIRATESADKSAARDFEKMMQTLRADSSGKETSLLMSKQDIKSGALKIKTQSSDLQANMNLLDDSLKELEKLKPTCIDTGMSYKERVAKREEEMASLQKALCMLDPEKTEASCKK